MVQLHIQIKKAVSPTLAGAGGRAALLYGVTGLVSLVLLALEALALTVGPLLPMRGWGLWVALGMGLLRGTVLGGLRQGRDQWMVEQSCGTAPRVRAMWAPLGLRRLGRTLWLELLLLLHKGAWALLVFSGPAVLVVFGEGYGLLYGGDPLSRTMAAMVKGLGISLGAVGAVLLVVIYTRYAGARALLAPRFGLTTRQALGLSVAVTGGRGAEILLFRLSYLPLLLAGVLVLPLFWVLPRYAMANALLVKAMVRGEGEPGPGDSQATVEFRPA